MGTHGVAFDATLVLLRMVPGTGNVAAPNVNLNVDPLNYLATLNNVRIFNASYGPGLPDSSPPVTVWPASFTDPAEAAAAQTALAAGKIIVAASGNDLEKHPVTGKNPSGLALYPFMQPSNANAGVYADGGNNFNFSALLNQPGSIVSVMAIDANKAAGSFSNLCGQTASWCVAAPGVDVLSVVPTTVNATGFATQSGTSQATPHVSGALAVLSQAYPNYTSQDLTKLMFATTEDLGAPGVDATFGYGLIRLDRAIEGPTGVAGNNIVGGERRCGRVPDFLLEQAVQYRRRIQQDRPRQPDHRRCHHRGRQRQHQRRRNSCRRHFVAWRQYPDGPAEHHACRLRTDQWQHIDCGRVVAGPIAERAGSGGEQQARCKHGDCRDLARNLYLPRQCQFDDDGEHPRQCRWQPGDPPAAGTFSKIVVTGANNTFTVGGTLSPVLRGIPGGNNNYVPDIGARFPFLTATRGARTTASSRRSRNPPQG